MRSLLKTLVYCGRAVVAAALVLSTSATRLPAKEGASVSNWTVKNCQAAYSAAQNAGARYRAYAAKADAENYPAVASLFRAAAAVEEVHAQNHQVLIHKLGGTPSAEIEVPQVQSTRENLRSSAEWAQRQEADMYAGFIQQAQQQSYRRVILEDTEAQKSSHNLARMFTVALQNIDHRADGHRQTYYVCEVDGHMLNHVDFDTCKTCFHSKKKFRAVS
jgi:rubrerythrin